MSDRRQIVLAITGASGVIYSLRLLEVLRAAHCDVHLTISNSGRAVLQHELELEIDLNRFDPASLSVEIAPDGTIEIDPGRSVEGGGRIIYHHYQDFFTPIASGSSLTDSMVICPCSGSTLGAIVHATGNNLIHRAADVHLKERRPLILVPRETPLSAIQLENMRRAAQAGVVVLPAMPGYYHGAKTVRDLVDFVVARICDQLKVAHHLTPRWRESGEGG